MDTVMSRLLKFAAAGCLLLAAPAFAAGTPPAIAGKIDRPVPASLLNSLTQSSESGLELAPGAGTPLYLQPVDGPRVAKGDKVGILYVGADFCPYCAGQRWALVLSLLRFGSFSNLRYMASSATDVYSNTPTFSFLHANYDSKYVTFQAVEMSDREGKKLQSMDQAQRSIFSTYDSPKYGMPGYGGFPFVYIDGNYVVTRPLVSPNMLGGMDWDQIAKAFNTPSSDLYQAAMPQVNAVTAAICRLDGGNPDKVCSAPGVTAANAALFRLGSQSGQ